MNRIAALTLTLSILVVAPVVAQEPAEDGPTNPAQETFVREGTMGAGVQLTWPTYGFSGMLDIGDRFGVQAVLGTAGSGLSLTGRGLFRLEAQELFRPYAYGEVGTWTGYRGFGGTTNVGAGGGIELDPRRILEELEDLPPVYVGLEAGLYTIRYGGGATWGFQAGTALHYRF